MKKIVLLSLLTLMSPLASCQKVADQDYEIHATVTHEDGRPVEGAELSALALILMKEHLIPVSKPKRTEFVETDNRGIAVLKFKSVPYPSGGVAISKKGYYGSGFSNANWEPIRGFNDGLWKAEVNTILKPIKNPIPMYAYSNIGGMERIANIPEIGREYGFDLMMAQALPPLGNGKHADFIFVLEGSYDRKLTHDLTLRIHFPNPHDGVVEFLTPKRTGMREPYIPGSQLLSDYLAPEEGYISEIVRTTRRTELDQRPQSNEDFRRNFYFRTRSQVDSSGRLIRANYGKIYGDFHFFAANKDWGYLATFVLVTTYFNPTSNDRNVEFDPKRNLISDGNVQRP